MKQGSLTLLSGGKEIIILNDKPFSLIQTEKSKMIREGYNKLNLKIKYKQ